LLVEVANPTLLSVRDLRLIIRYVDSFGSTRQTVRVVDRTLASGDALRLASGLGPFTNSNAYQVEFESAQVVIE
jgi:MinD superfamily P-loop ATPase